MAGTGSPRPPNAGKGRPKGSVNKTTALAKEAIEEAFSHLQKKPGKSLKAWAEANTDDFYKLIFPKLLPVQLNHANSDGTGDARVVHRIELVAPGGRD